METIVLAAYASGLQASSWAFRTHRWLWRMGVSLSPRPMQDAAELRGNFEAHWETAAIVP